MKKIILHSYYIVRFFLQLVSRDKWWKNIHAFRGHNGKRIMILANGPSLRAYLSTLQAEPESQDTVYSVMNFFCFEPEFMIIRPKYYSLADPMFINKDSRYEKVMKMYDYLDKHVNWTINLFIPGQWGEKRFREFSHLSNPNIHIKLVNDISFKEPNCLRNYLYSKGLAICPIITVAQLSIYVAINEGYDIINLYGMDHTSICNLFVDNNNHLCNKYSHFYKDTAEDCFKPIKHPVTGNFFKVSEFLYESHTLFKSHEYLEEYSNYVGTKIINCTPHSMIDSYQRN